MKSFLHYLPPIELKIIKAKYANGRTALRGIDSETGEVIGTFTVNIPDFPLKDDEVLIKDYSENRGVLKTLTESKYVKVVCPDIPCGYDVVTLCRLVGG
jgi:hypothetical protein